MNFGVNRAILASGFVIVGLTIADQWFVHGKTGGITKVLVGAYIALLVLALVDMIPGAQPVTTALALLAMFTTILMYGGDVFGLFGRVASAPVPTIPTPPTTVK